MNSLLCREGDSCGTCRRHHLSRQYRGALPDLLDAVLGEMTSAELDRLSPEVFRANWQDGNAPTSVVCYESVSPRSVDA